MTPDTIRALRPLTKMAGEILPVCVDFTALLATTEHLSGSPTVTVSPAGMTASNAAVLTAHYTPLAGADNVAIGKGISLLLTGGNSGQRYTLTITCATTTASRIVGGQVIVLIDA
jgi:hypothetical protein